MQRQHHQFPLENHPHLQTTLSASPKDLPQPERGRELAHSAAPLQARTPRPAIGIHEDDSPSPLDEGRLVERDCEPESAVGTAKYRQRFIEGSEITLSEVAAGSSHSRARTRATPRISAHSSQHASSR